MLLVMYQYEFLSFDKYTMVIQDVNVWGNRQNEGYSKTFCKPKIIPQHQVFLRYKKLANKKN